MDSKEIMTKLQAPFLPDEIEWRVGSTTRDKKKGLALAYVTNRAIQNRLDDVFGVFGWKNEFAEWKDKSQICGISIWDEDKKEWITKYDGADDSNMDPTKGGLSDAMKRAAYQWGIGRYLYKLPATWVPLKQIGNSYALAETPQLPKWALPEEYKPTDKPKPMPQQMPQEEQHTNKNSKSGNDLYCESCGIKITKAEKTFSEHYYKKSLCRNCQEAYKNSRGKKVINNAKRG